MKKNRWEPTAQNFGELAKTWSGNLGAVKPTVWEDFVQDTLNHAECQVLAYQYVDPATRAQWALCNSAEHSDYVHWQRLIQQYAQ